MLRSPRERLLQAVLYEAGGLVLTWPLYLIYAGHAARDGALVVLAVTLAVVVWSPLHNGIFDRIDWRLTCRRASDRPHVLRVLHAITHGVSTIVVTTPLLMWLGGHGLVEALLLDLALTSADMVWAYAFHLLFDRWRPVA